MCAINVINKILDDLKEKFEENGKTFCDTQEIEDMLRYIGTTWSIDEDRLECLEKAVMMESTEADYTRIMDVANELYENKKVMSEKSAEKLLSLLGAE